MIPVKQVYYFLGTYIPCFSLDKDTSLYILMQKTESKILPNQIQLILGNVNLNELVDRNEISQVLQLRLDHKIEQNFFLPLTSNDEIVQMGNLLFKYFQSGFPKEEIILVAARFADIALKLNKGIIEENQQILYLILYMYENVHRNLKVENFGKALNMSPSTLQRLCQKNLNQSVMKLFQKIKYQEAKRMLIETDDSIQEITIKLGFTSISYFSIFFKNFEGISPLEMKKKANKKGRRNIVMVSEDIMEHICKELLAILDDINKVLNRYSELKEKLEISDKTKEDTTLNRIKEESEYQQYIINKKKAQSVNDYQTISTTISSILKESSIPLSSKQIFEKLIEQNISITYSNLTNNILSRIHSDPKVNVERAYRGFWQYRLKG